MAKVKVEVVKMALQRNEPDPRKVAAIMEDLEAEILAEEEERAMRPPPVKKQFVVLISDPEGLLRARDFVGWVIQIPEEESPLGAPERIARAAYEFNASPRGRRLPVQTVGETMEVVSASIFKDQDVWVKTKTPILIVQTGNKIPTERIE